MSYMYYAGMDKSLSCGEDWRWDKTASSGGWMDVEMYVKLNTPGTQPRHLPGILQSTQLPTQLHACQSSVAHARGFQ